MALSTYFTDQLILRDPAAARKDQHSNSMQGQTLTFHASSVDRRRPL